MDYSKTERGSVERFDTAIDERTALFGMAVEAHVSAGGVLHLHGITERLEVEAGQGDARAARILAMRRNSNFALCTILWGNVAINVLLTLLVGSVLFGALALSRIPVQLAPDVRKPIVVVETAWPGAAPAEVEREIVNRQEEELKGIDNLESMISTSEVGRARITLEFAIGTNYGIKKFTKSILFDEKIGGSFHMALGAGYPETGGAIPYTLFATAFYARSTQLLAQIAGVLGRAARRGGAVRGARPRGACAASRAAARAARLMNTP